MPRKRTKCICGSLEFWVFEDLMHDGDIDPDDKKKVLYVSTNHSECETYKIVCKKCGKNFPPSSFTIEYT